MVSSFTLLPAEACIVITSEDAKAAYIAKLVHYHIHVAEVTSSAVRITQHVYE